MRNLINSFLFILICFGTYGQFKTKKYIKRNRKAPITNYSDGKIYSRGLFADSNRIFIGNSDGSLYYLNLKKASAKLIFKLPDFDEIRDVEFVNDKIIGLHSGKNGKLLYMDLKGATKVIKLDEWQGVFLDGMDFHGLTGFMMGDPKDSIFSIYDTKDGGLTWNKCSGEIKAYKQEAGFAASGSNVQVINDSTYVFVSGGGISRFFKSTNNGKSWKALVLPYYPGESTGAYSLNFMNDTIGVIVGGDYQDPNLRMNVSFYSNDGGESWYNSDKTVRGYRSCVISYDGIFYTCGRNGIDFSINNGVDWIPFADGAYFSLAISNDKLIATMKGGSIQFFNLMERK